MTPLVVAALLGLGWDRRYARLLASMMVGLIIGALVTWWAISHMVIGGRTSSLARMILRGRGRRAWSDPSQMS